jgi:monothiol glutaredoxin
MTVLTDALRAHLDQLTTSHRVVLFMKGERRQPQCGFSARVVGMLDGHIEDYVTVDVLANMTLREGLKEYAQWPTFPQLWVDGELVGGCDIVTELESQGQLASLLGASEAPPLQITLTEAARDRILGVLAGAAPLLRLEVDARFRYQFAIIEAPEPSDLTTESQGITLVLDRVSARRAHGMTMDFVSGPRGSGLVVDNPNEPPAIQQLSVQDLQRWRSEGRPHHLIDVRTEGEWRIARIEGATLLDSAGQELVDGLPKEATLVFQCHHGVRSQHAAEHFLARGHRNVYNLTGGIEAWSTQIDPDVPRY